MVERQITAKIHFCTLDELSEQEKILVKKAKDATLKAYAPYSAFRVGAALLLDNGETVTGNNQENAAYPSGLCAERVAMFYANANWPDVAIQIMVVAAQSGNQFIPNPIAPCGSCRQSLLEAERRYKQPIRIILYGTTEIAVVDAVSDLLPLSFDETFFGK